MSRPVAIRLNADFSADDTAHRFIAPGPNDIRGPCPGLNTAANHGFLSRDGIVTFAELTDTQQNVYGVGYDLAVLLAVLGVGLDGDPITTKLSLGCDATSRTATPGLGPELGLDGHNKFEGDTSLTRNDYFTAGGDNYKFNNTLYTDMINNYCKDQCNRDHVALYRKARYDWSVQHNGNFYFGPKSVLLFGASSFLYELFPSFGEFGTANPTTMSYFFQKVSEIGYRSVVGTSEIPSESSWLRPPYSEIVMLTYLTFSGATPAQLVLPCRPLQHPPRCCRDFRSVPAAPSRFWW